MDYQYFIASRWRNRDLVLELTEKLRNKKKKVYCFMESKANFHTPQDDPEEAMREFESISSWREHTMVKEIFKQDMDALKKSKRLILLLPAGKSSHIEAGVAYGLGKHLILIGEQKEAESLYLIFNERYPSIDDFVATLTE